MLQKVNTALLVAILGVLVFVALRPQPNRFRYLTSLAPGVFDTATGKLTLPQVSQESQEWDIANRSETAELQRVYCSEALAGTLQFPFTDLVSHDACEKIAAQKRWLDENCAAVLARTLKVPRSNSVAIRQLHNRMAIRHELECQEWEQAQRTASDPGTRTR